jgi:hypothetical protein
MDEKAKKAGEMTTFQAVDPSLLSASTPGTHSSYESTLGEGSPIVLDGNERGIWRREKQERNSEQV